MATGAGNGGSPERDLAEIAEIEAALKAIIARLDGAGQMLAAAYVELALGVLTRRPDQLPPFPCSDEGDSTGGKES